MIPYKNMAGNSGVVAYQIEPDGIAVQFIGGDTYVYTNASVGAQSIKQMKQLAETGRGLSTFISTVVKDSYERKL